LQNPRLFLPYQLKSQWLTFVSKTASAPTVAVTVQAFRNSGYLIPSSSSAGNPEQISQKRSIKLDKC
jgi:hypothetical protein